MGWSGQEDGMDVMKEIIQKEIQSISSLEERVIFKNLMEGVFLSLYDTNRRCTRDWSAASKKNWTMTKTAIM